jgi:hypothetical protein
MSDEQRAEPPFPHEPKALGKVASWPGASPVTIEPNGLPVGLVVEFGYEKVRRAGTAVVKSCTGTKVTFDGYAPLNVWCCAVAETDYVYEHPPSMKRRRQIERLYSLNCSATLTSNEEEIVSILLDVLSESEGK